MKFNLVCGPPGGGKNTFIAKHFKQGDIILDFDRLYDAITMQGEHVIKNKAFLGAVSAMKQCCICELMKISDNSNVWVIACIPEGRKREVTARQLRNASIYMIMPNEQQCIEQIEKDEKRQYPKEHGIKIVREWYSKYSPSKKDILIPADGIMEQENKEGEENEG